MGKETKPKQQPPQAPDTAAPLTLEQILAGTDVLYKDVPTPEWGANSVVRVRALSGIDRTTLMATSGEVTVAEERLQFLALAICDQDLEPMFTDPADIERLGKKSWKVLERLTMEAQRLNGLAPESLEDAIQD